MEKPNFNWRVREFEGRIYLTSNTGRIFLRGEWTEGQEHHGYKMLDFVYAHRIVASAWVDNPNSYNVVDHIDENRSNNNPHNLQWVTKADNFRLSRERKRWKRAN
jgi:hypothetical protein